MHLPVLPPKGGLVSCAEKASVSTMRFSLLLASAAAAIVAPAFAGPAEQAHEISSSYDRDFKLWVLKLNVAPTAEERNKLAQERPDAAAAAKKMWAVLQPNLSQPWTLEPAAWLLRNSGKLVSRDEVGNTKPLMAEASIAIREAMLKHHLANKDLAPLCLAMVASNDGGALPFLERVEKESPNKQVQGVAALSVAMILKNLSDEPEVMRRRLTMLRKAIIESSDVEISGVSVAKLAEDELYIIQHLSKGRQAPDLQGVGSGGQPMKLSDYQGKVVVLLFWRSEEGNNELLVEMVRNMRERFTGKPFEVVGVSRDPKEVLRSMQAGGEIAWPNFSDPENKLGAEYRIAGWPLAYVLDGDRRIHYVGAMGSFVELTAAAVLEEK